MRKVIPLLLFSLLFLVSCNAEDSNTPSISDEQIIEIAHVAARASQNVNAEDVWVYVSTGETGKDAPTTVISIPLNRDADSNEFIHDCKSITESLRGIDFEIPFSGLSITCYDAGKGGENPALVYMTDDLQACTITDYRGSEPVLNEYLSTDELTEEELR